jgi:hypothetical protein
VPPGVAAFASLAPRMRIRLSPDELNVSKGHPREQTAPAGGSRLAPRIRSRASTRSARRMRPPSRTAGRARPSSGSRSSIRCTVPKDGGSAVRLGLAYLSRGRSDDAAKQSVERSSSCPRVSMASSTLTWIWQRSGSGSVRQVQTLSRFGRIPVHAQIPDSQALTEVCPRQREWP